MFYSCKSQFREKKSSSPIEKFPSLVLLRDMRKLQHLNIHIPLYYLSSGRLWEVTNKRRLQTFGSKSGCSCLREVITYKRFQTERFDWKTFGILEKQVAEERWSLTTGGRNRRFDCIISILPIECLIVTAS